MFKSKEMCWKDCVCWEGELYTKGVEFSYLNTEREQGPSLFSSTEFPVNSLTNCERYIKTMQLNSWSPIFSFDLSAIKDNSLEFPKVQFIALWFSVTEQV